jgi:VWFA-related protein
VRAAITFALAIAAATQTAPPTPPVRIDAVATDRAGRLVDTLRAEDFEIVENGVSRDVSGVQFVKADGALEPGEIAPSIASAADEQLQAARDGTRLFAIFLDEFHVTPGDGAARARAVLADLVQRVFGPRDLILIAKPLDSLLTLRMTRDRDAVLRAIERFEGRKGSYEPRSPLETSIFAGDRTRIEAARVQVVTSALNAMATHLGRLSGTRKAIVVVSEGFPRPPRRRGEGALPTVDGVIRAANRGTVSIYPLDPRALIQGPAATLAATPAAGEAAAPPDGRDVLTALAAETDGLAMLTPEGVKAGVDRLVRDTSGYYLLSFAGPEVHDGGRFHPVDVRVKKAGIAVRARKGYWTATPDDLFRASAAARERMPAAPPPLPRRASPLIRPWFGVTRGPSGDSQVNFVWEPAARVPGERIRPTAPVRISFKALGADGRTIFEGAVRPAGALLGPTDAPSQLVFTAPTGRLRVEMAIEDATARVLDTDVRDVVVRPLAGPIALATPQVLRSRTAREHRQLEASAQAVPVAARQFSRLERLWIRTAAYAADDEPRVSARLLSAIGGQMRTLDVRSAPAGGSQVDLPLAGLAAGEYSVEFAAANGASQATETVTFRVTP